VKGFFITFKQSNTTWHSTVKYNITCNTDTESVCTATAVLDYYTDSMKMIKMCYWKSA